MSSVSIVGVTKRFPGAAALTDVSFEIRSGSCHAICGENGAGKSTLGRIIAGLIQPDAGAIHLDGAPVHFDSPRDALAAGVAMVHQELAFCPNLTVGENLCLHALPRRAGFVDRTAVADQARQALERVGATIDPRREMQSLSIADQQLVQIAFGVAAGARVIVFDEPTSSLGVSESDALFTLVERLRERGITILYISHRMPEIHRLCDEITVLRDGRHVATSPAAALDDAALVRLMIGRAIDPESATPKPVPPAAEERIRLESLSRAGAFEDVSFSIRAGEVLGLAGLVGAGRSEIAQTLFGLAPATSGRVLVRGREARIRSAQDAIALGLGFVPEDRKLQGLVLCMPAGENATLPTVGRFARWGWLSPSREGRAIRGLFERLGVRASPYAQASALSGGNQQKLVMAKWLESGSEVLILDEPTRGVDVGAKAELHAWIAERAASGCAVLVISSELPELLSLSSRVVVLRGGRVAGELSRDAATQDAVLRLMTGVGEAAIGARAASPQYAERASH